jgi:hypothetical protein
MGDGTRNVNQPKADPTIDDYNFDGVWVVRKGIASFQPTSIFHLIPAARRLDDIQIWSLY